MIKDSVVSIPIKWVKYYYGWKCRIGAHTYLEIYNELNGPFRWHGCIEGETLGGGGGLITAEKAAKEAIKWFRKHFRE